jgi:hypothetical protein
MSKTGPQTASGGRPDFASLARAMRLRAHQPERSAQNELYRLRQRGLIRWRPKRMEWALEPEQAQGVSAVVAGRAFAVATR